MNVENAIENYSFNEAARHIYKCLWRYNKRMTTDELIVLLLGLLYEQEKMTEQQKARIYKRVFSLVGEVSEGGES